MVYWLWISYMFWSLLGHSSDCCIKLKSKGKTVHKIYTSFVWFFICFCF